MNDPRASSNSKVSHIVPVLQYGTNSTMFTECCRVAITHREPTCPRCKSLVVGHDAPTDHERGHIRWRDATFLWDRSRKT